LDDRLMSKLHNEYLTFTDRAAPLMRRVQGDHDLRLDGIGDLLSRARGASVFDIGCNRGRVCDDFARNGAARVAGCDIYKDGIIAARHLFCDYRSIEHRFECVDLTGGAAAIRKAFGQDAELHYDVVLMLATFHKLKRIMTQKALTELMLFFGERTKRYFGWRGYMEEIALIDGMLGRAGLERVQTSMISDIQPAAIWARR
jgi:SAM-dependent methyltransferase